MPGFNIHMRAAISFLIRAYQLVVSPWLGSRCRFSPSCSVYALEALRVHGTMRGGWLALKRLGRCHPWHAGGYDPVPEAPPRLGQSAQSHQSAAKATPHCCGHHH